MAETFDLMVAPNGARLTKSNHPAVPLTAAELAETARACAEAGAGAIHLHVRDEAGRHSLDAALYRAAIAAISAQSGIGIQISTEAVGRFSVGEQIGCIRDIRAPDVSIALREVLREPDRLAEAYETARRAGSDVQHILYSPEDLRMLRQCYDDGAVPGDFNRVLFVLGRYSESRTAEPEDLRPFLNELADDPLHWSTCAFGRHEQACLLAAIREGGHARIGFENNTLAPDGHPFRDNAEAVGALVDAAAREGFKPRQVG